MGRSVLGWLAVFLVGSAATVDAQDRPPRPGDKHRPDKPETPEHVHLSSEEALTLLNEVKDLMASSEKLLYTSSFGKALKTESEILRKIESLRAEDPKGAQQTILKKIDRLLGLSEGNQKDSIGKIGKIIKRGRD